MIHHYYQRDSVGVNHWGCFGDIEWLLLDICGDVVRARATLTLIPGSVLDYILISMFDHHSNLSCGGSLPFIIRWRRRLYLKDLLEVMLDLVKIYHIASGLYTFAFLVQAFSLFLLDLGEEVELPPELRVHVLQWDLAAHVLLGRTVPVRKFGESSDLLDWVSLILRRPVAARPWIVLLFCAWKAFGPTNDGGYLLLIFNWVIAAWRDESTGLMFVLEPSWAFGVRLYPFLLLLALLW